MLHRLSFALLIAGVVVAAHSVDALRPLERWLSEVRFSHATRAPTGSIVLVDIDAKSIEAIGRWPWPRSVHARLIDALTEIGASEIALDIDLSSSSAAEEDAALEAALQRAKGLVILPAFRQTRTAGDADFVYNRPIQRFAEHAWDAVVHVRPDSDGTVRRLPYGETLDGEPVPGIAAYYGNETGQIDREFLVDFGIRAAGIDRISVIDLLQSRVDRARVAGKKVIIGATAAELRDLFRVPVHGVVSGSMLHALGAETLLQGRALDRVSGTPMLGGVLVISAVIVFGLRRIRLLPVIGILAASAIGIEIVAILLQQRAPLALDTSAWQAALLASGVFAMAREIDLRRVLLAISRNEVRNARAVLEQVVADNFAGVVVADEDGTIHSASRVAGKLIGARSDDLIGRRVADVLPPALARSVEEAIASHRDGRADKPAPREVELERGEDGSRIFEYVATPSRLTGGVSQDGAALPDRLVACLTFLDVTERRRAEARIAYMARFDTLTALPNRNQFCERLAELMERNRFARETYAAACIDLDRFKAVNDTLGHDYGDLLLCAVADRLRAVAGPDEFVARFGGDEYAVILSSPATPAEASRLAERLIAALSEPYEIDGRRPIIGVSVGIAMIEPDETDPLVVLKNADTALYRAKAAGGNAYRFFDAEMAVGLRARHAMEVDLTDALRHNELEVFYQPQVSLADESILGVEALLRWRHPQRGFVSPADFIPIAEDTGLIDTLGAWVLERACTDAARWAKPIRLAVNVSPVQFARGNLLAAVAAALRKSGFPPGMLDLEITESLFLDESKSTDATVQELRNIGISLALDDFGTGYSSLNYVRKLPIDRIKIDRSFISLLPFDRDSLAIVRAITALAEGLDLRVVAEGIERDDQVKLLRALRCEEGQGFLFGRPQSAAEIARLLESGPARLNLSA